MGLNKVADEIRFKAEKEAQRIINEGKSEGEGILEETRKRLREYEETIRKETSGGMEQINVRSQTLARKQAKELAMDARREVVEKVYQQFLGYLRNVKGGERDRIFRKMLAGARKQISKPRAVYVRKEDAAIARKLFKGLEVRTRDMHGGFVLESGDGKEIVDYSFETLVEMLKGRTLKSVSGTLFGDR